MRYKFFFLLLIIISCTKEVKEKHYVNFQVDENIKHNDSIRVLSKLVENKLYANQKITSASKTAWVINHQAINEISLPSLKFPRGGGGSFNPVSIYTDNYQCKARYINDTLRVFVNNYNGLYGNGLLISVFNGQFYTQNFDPSSLDKGNEMHFKKDSLIIQKLVLNQKNYSKGDSLYGYIRYKGFVGKGYYKMMVGYFRTKVQ